MYPILKLIKNNKDKIFSKDSFFVIIILGLIIMLLLKSCEGHDKDKQAIELQKTILALDKTVKESEGSYKKLVDNVNTTSKSLEAQLKESNSDLAKRLKKSDEKLLMISKTVATFDGKLDKGIAVVTTVDSTGNKVIKFATRYPNNDPGKDWFIEYNGTIYTQTNKLDGEWKFNKLDFDMILTEQKNGMWSWRIDGPDYLKVDSILVNALPKEQIAAQNKKKINIVVGAGYRTLMDLKTGGALTLNGGVEFNQKNIILFDASSNKYIGVTFLRKLK